MKSPKDTRPLGSFALDWLHLRERHDAAARDRAIATAEGLATALRRSANARWVPGRARGARVLRIMDLGCGTGATLRYLAPRLGGSQRWRVYDHDIGLLQAWPTEMADWARREGYVVEARVTRSNGNATAPDGMSLRIDGGPHFSATVECHCLELSRHLDTLPFAETDLLCATALLDLVSARWVAELIDRARAGDVALSLALMVDGRIEWEPPINGDALVARAFSDHQVRDKGFGPALGARAPELTRQLLEQAGYEVEQARSDWVLQGEDGAALQAVLIEGMAKAALEQEPAAAEIFERWRIERASAVGRSCLRTGHVDIVSLPRRLGQ